MVEPARRVAAYLVGNTHMKTVRLTRNSAQPRKPLIGTRSIGWATYTTQSTAWRQTQTSYIPRLKKQRCKNILEHSAS